MGQFDRPFYEPIPGHPTMFRHQDGNIVHLSEKEQAELGLPSRVGEKLKKRSGMSIKEEREGKCLCGPVEKWPAGMLLCPTCGKRRAWARDLSKIPMTAWGRHELEAEVKRLHARVVELVRTGGLCHACEGSGRHPQELGVCPSCDGTKTFVGQAAQLSLRCNKLEVAAQEAMKKADAHRRQRDALQEKLDVLAKAGFI